MTTWIGGPISQSVLEDPSWRRGFGIFTIVVPIVVAPLSILFWNQRNARKLELLASSKGPIILSTIKRHCVEVDLFGIILLAGGMALFPSSAQSLVVPKGSMALGNYNMHGCFWRTLAHRIRNL